MSKSQRSSNMPRAQFFLHREQSSRFLVVLVEGKTALLQKTLEFPVWEKVHLPAKRKTNMRGPPHSNPGIKFYLCTSAHTLTPPAAVLQRNSKASSVFNKGVARALGNILWQILLDVSQLCQCWSSSLLRSHEAPAPVRTCLLRGAVRALPPSEAVMQAYRSIWSIMCKPASTHVPEIKKNGKPYFFQESETLVEAGWRRQERKTRWWRIAC